MLRAVSETFKQTFAFLDFLTSFRQDLKPIPARQSSIKECSIIRLPASTAWRGTRAKAVPPDEKWRTIVLMSHHLTWAHRTGPGSIYNLLWQATPTAYEKKYHFFFVINLYVSFAQACLWTDHEHSSPDLPSPTTCDFTDYCHTLPWQRTTSVPLTLSKQTGAAEAVVWFSSVPPNRQKKLWRWGQFSKCDTCLFKYRAWVETFSWPLQETFTVRPDSLKTHFR